MAIKINLLSDEFRLKKEYVVFGKILNKLTLILGALLFVVVLGLVGYIAFLTVNLGGIQKEVGSLKENIKNLQTSEQKIVLLKDRIGKIRSIKSSYKLYKELDNMKVVVNAIPADSVLGELTLDKTKSTLSIRVNSPEQLSQLLNGLYEFDLYKNIVLNSLGFNQSAGYTVGLTMEYK